MVVIQAGTYAETIEPYNSGTANAGIVYKAADGNSRPKILGSPDKESAVIINHTDDGFKGSRIS